MDPFNCIWTDTVHSGSGNDIINDQANSQLIMMIIPKEALAGLLTLAKQEYESHSLVHAAVAHLAVRQVHSSVKEAHCCTSERDWLTTKGTQCSLSLYPQANVMTFFGHMRSRWPHTMILPPSPGHSIC